MRIKPNVFLALQLKVIDLFDNWPALAWGAVLLLAGMTSWHGWGIISAFWSSTDPEQLRYHFLMASLFAIPNLFMLHCRVHRLDIASSTPINQFLDNHDGPIPQGILEIMKEIAVERGIQDEFAAFLARYDALEPPTTQVVYGMLITLAEDKERASLSPLP
ncbi:hypothetical protein [Serratia fonticola]|uniref:hypothetical protein n=1 Tax=Serratia fonticola TaxID=47917 RepID=UPI000E0EC8EE|nr:hypothetical protein [Serratia fonticola]RDL15600.1 hypothetical protein DFO62_12310 [Serratia fonticola]